MCRLLEKRGCRACTMYWYMWKEHQRIGLQERWQPHGQSTVQTFRSKFGIGKRVEFETDPFFPVDSELQESRPRFGTFLFCCTGWNMHGHGETLRNPPNAPVWDLYPSNAPGTPSLKTIKLPVTKRPSPHRKLPPPIEVGPPSPLHNPNMPFWPPRSWAIARTSHLPLERAG